MTKQERTATNTRFHEAGSMTLPIMPCHRGPCCPPVAGVLLLALALAGCEAPLRGFAEADAAEPPPRVELIETHSLARAGVTLGGSVLGPGEAVRTADERPRAW
jgi:hypothetical protein